MNPKDQTAIGMAIGAAMTVWCVVAANGKQCTDVCVTSVPPDGGVRACDP